MAGMIPLFLVDDEEKFSKALQRVFRERTDSFDGYDDLELIQRFRFSRS